MSNFKQQSSTEELMQALFALAQKVNTPATPFKVMSRRFVHYDQAPPMPAFYQFQEPGISVSKGVRGLPVHERKVKWIVYLPNSVNNQPCSPLMNVYYDALSNILLPQPGGPVPFGGATANRNTLGGLCTNCYEDGRGMAGEGLLTTPSLIVIPITIINGI